jgi:hypothetical protein
MYLACAKRNSTHISSDERRTPREMSPVESFRIDNGVAVAVSEFPLDAEPFPKTKTAAPEHQSC